MSVNMLAIVALVCMAGVWPWMKVGRYGMQLIGLLLVIAAILGFLFIHTFQLFSSRTLVATVHASTVANAPHVMLIDLTTYDSRGKPTTATHEIGGDLWSLQASVVEFRGWTKFLGIKSGFQLNRIDGEYSDPNHENAKPVLLNGGGSVFYQSISALMYIPIIQSAYGNAVVDPPGSYKIYADTNGDMSAQRA